MGEKGRYPKAGRKELSGNLSSILNLFPKTFLSCFNLDGLLFSPMLWFVILSLSFAGQSSHLYRIPCFLNCVCVFLYWVSPYLFETLHAWKWLQICKVFSEIIKFLHRKTLWSCACLQMLGDLDKEGWSRVGLCFSNKNIDFHLIPLFQLLSCPWAFLYLLTLNTGFFWFIFTRISLSSENSRGMSPGSLRSVSYTNFQLILLLPDLCFALSLCKTQFLSLCRTFLVPKKIRFGFRLSSKSSDFHPPKHIAISYPMPYCIFSCSFLFFFFVLYSYIF